MKYKTLLLQNGAEVSTIKKLAKSQKEMFGSYSKALNHHSQNNTNLSFNKAIKLSKKYNLMYYNDLKKFNLCRIETDFYYKQIKKTVVIDAFGAHTINGRHIFKNRGAIPFDSFKNLDNKTIKRDGNSLTFEFLDYYENIIKIIVNQDKDILNFEYFKNGISKSRKYDKFFYNKTSKDLSKAFLYNLEHSTKRDGIFVSKDETEMSVSYEGCIIKGSIIITFNYINRTEVKMTIDDKRENTKSVHLANVSDLGIYIDCDDPISDFPIKILKWKDLK